MANWHGVDFSYYQNRGWVLRLCENDGVFYAYEMLRGAVVNKVVCAPDPTTLLNRLTDYLPMEETDAKGN